MAALGQLVFILAFMGITRSALIVPLWQHLPEVPRQQEMAAEPEDDYQDTKQVIIASGPLCSGYLGDWSYCLDFQSNIYSFKTIRVLKSLRLH